MNEQNEKKTYSNAQLADKEYYARPRWHEVAINERSGNLNLTVVWGVCDRDGTLGNFDVETGAETPLPDGMDGWEAISKTYLIAAAEEAQNLAKCRGKDIEYLKDVCPKTYRAMKHILDWCPGWDPKRAMWFTDCRDEFYATIVRVTCVHEEWNGRMRAKAKWTNPRDRKSAPQPDTSAARAGIRSHFGGFFDVAESAPAPKSAALPPPPPGEPPAPAYAATKADCWAAYCRAVPSKDTTAWFNYIKGFGKAESRFTPEDWWKLKEEIENPMPF